MYRVVLALCVSVLLPGCSGNIGTVTSGLTGSGSSAESTRSSLKGAKLAKLDDHAPVGTFEKAPKGALSDRDYSGTQLEPQRALELINAYRKSKNLKPLTLDTRLTDAAKGHSRDLAKWDRISHYGSDGSNPWDRVKRAGYNARLAAENVGTGQATIDEAFKGWQESPGHNKNLLLPDATQLGIALVQDPKTEFKTFWTMVLATPL